MNNELRDQTKFTSIVHNNNTNLISQNHAYWRMQRQAVNLDQIYNEYFFYLRLMAFNLFQTVKPKYNRTILQSILPGRSIN